MTNSRYVFRTELLIESTDWLGSLDFPPLKIGFSIHHPGEVGDGHGSGDRQVRSWQILLFGNRVPSLILMREHRDAPTYVWCGYSPCRADRCLSFLTAAYLIVCLASLAT